MTCFPKHAISEVGGSEFAFRQSPATGKSFRFVRACDARCLDVKRNPGAKTRRRAFPFSLLAPGGFPFSLLAPMRPSDPLPLPTKCMLSNPTCSQAAKVVVPKL